MFWKRESLLFHFQTARFRSFPCLHKKNYTLCEKVENNCKNAGLDICEMDEKSSQNCRNNDYFILHLGMSKKDRTWVVLTKGELQPSSIYISRPIQLLNPVFAPLTEESDLITKQNRILFWNFSVLPWTLNKCDEWSDTRAGIPSQSSGNYNS